MNANEGTSEGFDSLVDGRIAYRQLETVLAAELRCLQCGAPVANAVCGRKSPCSFCGFPYPLGDCSDLAEN